MNKHLLMKTIKYILSSILLISGIYACNDDWDSHYSQEEQVVNNVNITVVNKSAVDYLQSQPELSTMYQLFSETGVLDEMIEKDLLFTILVVNDDNALSRAVVTDDRTFLAKSHISDISLSPSNLSDGQRVLMWNGKYINVSKVENEDNATSISFNGIAVKKITKVNNGYVYEIEDYVETPKSLYELIEGLGDDYSIFREMIMERNQLTFDKEASKIIGVDETGSNVYDSIFIVTNPYFEAQGFNMMSESLSATVLIPSNEVVNRALTVARQNLQEWGMLREDSILENWTFQSVFFDKKLSKSDFEANIDLNSIFSKQWRTTVQQVDLENPVSLSNGVAYYVTDMKIPTNVLIYRVKDYMRWYEYLSEEEKALYFDNENLTFDKMETKVSEWSGWPGVFPNIINRVVRFKTTDAAIKEYTLNFTAFSYDEKNKVTTPYKIPPGEYDLCLGFEQKMGHDVEVSFNGEYVGTVTASQLTKTDFHYDRGGQGYPEGYDVNKATDKKKTNYDRDGGKVGVITIEGTEPVNVVIKFHGINASKCCFHHWCLKPTKNCY
ncbi:hypothetical protein [Bacteroides finegoldii]|jgi:hypothetical protein|uniref:FAS1 domain-containing protein n=1 Tax=Bacteroides finegoldii TaxID=338188 RepID=A0A7J4YTR8_9BACE|nr:hypothetical protein [Bacteroides finegoldii]EEX46287.1 hypothetical protein BACFIN_06065 [Bacteroides finegoldii DSM 17565]KAA5218039.1 hypothetical protein F2Z28_05955 [Bacteroides finegoldii]KAA5221821.1 hypothetical protein F2Z16_07135 [Bacteroides finegoldii]KAA5227600.1 hypothetical protein F2Z20_03735 [Bacteroides finegoldii]KAA5232753.1 hypothetical protein F2Z22_01885 [Bacteroides finegoldii]